MLLSEFQKKIPQFIRIYGDLELWAIVRLDDGSLAISSNVELGLTNHSSGEKAFLMGDVTENILNENQ